MKIEAGKYYRTRDGQVFGPMERDPSDENYPWYLGFDYPEICWTEGGRWSLDDSKYPLDLVAEVHVSDTPPQTAPAPEAKTLRDEFAKEVMGSLLYNRGETGTFVDYAQNAYEYADAMMEARKK